MTLNNKLTKSIAAIVLAAGKGTRLSALGEDPSKQIPKALRMINKKPMIEHVLGCLNKVGPLQTCLILQDPMDEFRPVLNAYKPITVCLQKERNGTGGALAVASYGFKDRVPTPFFAKGSFHEGPLLEGVSGILILAGDTPNLDPYEIQAFLEFSLMNQFDLSVCGMTVPNPTGYGRLIFEDSHNPLLLKSIIEEKDADMSIKKINHCNSGVLFVKTPKIFELLNKLDCKNAQGEYYLTDCISLGQQEGLKVGAYLSKKWESFLGVNTVTDLLQLESYMKASSSTSDITLSKG